MKQSTAVSTTRWIVMLTAFANTLVNAQTTFTGCYHHTHDRVTVEYCVGADGVKSPLATYAPSLSSGMAAAITGVPTNGSNPQTTAVTRCHAHEGEIVCINGSGSEVVVQATRTGEIPGAYTGCRMHGAELLCVDPQGLNVTVVAASTGEEASKSTSSECHFHAGVEHCVSVDSTEGSMHEEEEDCHFHAGVEHCGSHNEANEAIAVPECGLRERDYNVGLRVGTLFVVLVTSAIGVFAPTLLSQLALGSTGAAILMLLKQFGTGIIIATAFIHLYTHAQLMFQNQCVGSLEFEGTTAAIVMGGVFLSFVVEYTGLRLVASRQMVGPDSQEQDGNATRTDQAASGKDKDCDEEPSRRCNRALVAASHHHHGFANSKLSVLVTEAGILFHSILIGLTLVVAGDSFYKTLLVVIVFHQFFEGLALGARIALLAGPIFPTKFIMCTTFALITPLGMAIGIGVLNTFNGNNPSTVIAIGTLDALSAGILIWVGVVDMWARDWVIDGGELFQARLFKTLGGGFSLVTGMVLMGLLGKWA